MKWIAAVSLSILALFGPQGSAAQTPSVEGRPIVVFIHGRNQMWETSDLEDRWFDSFEDGLAKLAPNAMEERQFRSLIPEHDRMLVRYESVFEPDFVPSAWCGGRQVDAVGKLASTAFQVETLLGELRAASGESAETNAALSEVENSAADYMNVAYATHGTDAVAKASLLSGFLHRMRDGAVEMFGVDASLRFIDDTRRYLMKGPHHCETNLRLQLVLDAARRESRPVIIVAHSMGAMVTFDQLWGSNNTDYDVRRFVSIGSQLGVPELLRYLRGAGTQTPLLPRAIHDWVNIKGENDLIGFLVDPASVRFVGQGGTVVNSTQETGGMGDAHAATRYLQLRETAAAVADAYCSAFPGEEKPAPCVTVSLAQVAGR